jgi:hypothetical protein
MLAAMCYNEESELTRYIWANYAHLMSPREQEVGQVIQARLLAERPSSSPRRIPLEELPATRFQDPAINHDLACGNDPYRQRAALKLLLAQPERVRISRCQRCKRILRAPDAQACYWCGLDWHDGRVWKPRDK